MKTISIIGASGFIGNSMFNFFKTSLGNNFIVKGTCFPDKINDNYVFLDITQSKSLENYLGKNNDDFIILLAGTKDVARCQEDYGYAYRLNTRPVECIVESIAKVDLKTKVIFFSTDYVFDGEKGNYKDIDKPNPKTNYGKTNLLSEKILSNSGVDFKILRTSSVMGKGGTFFDWITKAIKSDKEIKLFSNAVFSPTPIRFLNEITKKLILNYESLKEKILHIAGEKKISRYELGLLLSSLVKTGKSRLIPESADFSNSSFQKDLSLIRSDFVKANQEKKFEQYMQEEITND